MKKYIGIFTFLIIVFVSCADTTNNKLIIGSWDGTEWLIDGKPSGHRASETHFTFDSAGRYTFRYVGNNETGTYKVENDMLFTKPEGQREIMVKITKLTADSLTFDMNRSGQPETLFLTRSK